MKFSTRASLALWHRREAYRLRRLNFWHQRNNQREVRKWKALHEAALRMIHRRESQLNPLRVRAFRVAEAEIGVSEEGANNRGKRVEQYIRANGGAPGEAWCGDFVAYDYLMAGAKSVVRAWASVSWLAKLLAKVKNPRRGHVVIYNFDHTGLFDRWLTGGEFEAVEGNTGDVGAVSDSLNGKDGVKRKRRHISQVSGFRRVLR